MAEIIQHNRQMDGQRVKTYLLPCLAKMRGKNREESKKSNQIKSNL